MSGAARLVLETVIGTPGRLKCESELVSALNSPAPRSSRPRSHSPPPSPRLEIFGLKAGGQVSATAGLLREALLVVDPCQVQGVSEVRVPLEERNAVHFILLGPGVTKDVEAVADVDDVDQPIVD